MELGQLFIHSLPSTLFTSCWSTISFLPNSLPGSRLELLQRSCGLHPHHLCRCGRRSLLFGRMSSSPADVLQVHLLLTEPYCDDGGQRSITPNKTFWLPVFFHQFEAAIRRSQHGVFPHSRASLWRSSFGDRVLRKIQTDGPQRLHLLSALSCLSWPFLFPRAELSLDSGLQVVWSCGEENREVWRWKKETEEVPTEPSVEPVQIKRLEGWRIINRLRARK